MTKLPDPTPVDAPLLSQRPLPAPAGSKRSRGEVVVIGGARRSPGAAQLAGLAALRVGAGRLTVAIAEQVAGQVAVALPECGVVPLSEDARGRIRGRSVRTLRADLATADAVLVGPGLDQISETRTMLRELSQLVPDDTVVILDAFALGAAARRPRLARLGRTILTPNLDEAARLLGRPISEVSADVPRIASKYRATVTCQGNVADPKGQCFVVSGGGAGLGTSGSGDVLAGCIAGLAARGCDPLDAALWGTYLHTTSGRALAERIATVGFLAREIADRLPAELAKFD